MGNKEQNFISAVIYVHNSESLIEPFLKTVIRVLEENFEHSEVICVNDASGDGSLAAIRKASSAASAASVSVVNMSYFHGLEMAMNAGADLAIGDFVLEFDGACPDFEPEEIMRIYRHSLTGYDIVSASPDRQERFTSALFYRVFNQYAHLSGKITTERFRILSRRAINRISSLNKTIPYRKAVYANCGLKTDCVKYAVREAGARAEDRREKRYRAGLAVDTMILFTDLGYKFSMAMTMVMMLMSVFMIVYSVAVYVTAHPVAGWTTTVLFLSCAFFGLFGILTIIIKYLGLLVDLVFRKKRYVFEGVEKLTD